MLSIRRIVMPAIVGAALALAAGCATQRPPDVPASAVIGAAGNKQVTYTAQDYGKVWVTDKQASNIIYSAAVRPGDRLTLDPDRNVVTMNDQVVFNQGLSHNDHEIYFQAGPPPTTPVTVVQPESSTVIVPAPAAPAAVIIRPTDIPSSAVVRSESIGRSQLSADTDGTVWVVDTVTDRVVYTGRMLRGDTLLIDPDNHTLLLDNKPAATISDLPTGKYRVYFAPAGSLR
jgi:hypothetical protein